MHNIKIIGSTDFGWHNANQLSIDALLAIAAFADVFYFNITIGGAHLAPSTIYGYARAAGCPFTLGDAHAVLEMLRPLLLEQIDGPINRCG